MEELNLLKSIFDYIRVVNPAEKKIAYGFGPEELHVITHNECYSFWKKNSVCDNCIGMRAIAENKTLVKFEMVSGKIYLVMSSPYKLNGELRALELIKDISEYNFFDIINKIKITEYSELIEALNHAVITDDLTGLYNKRFVEEHLPYDLKMLSFTDENIFVGIADIDHFKHVNDIYGHVVGDKVLKKIGEILKLNIRSAGDWIARYGGEEFMIVIKGGDELKFLAICERIRTEIESIKMQFSENELSITISIGGVSIHPNSNCNMEELISRADKNLYRAKENGRNQCVIERIDRNLEAN